MASGSPGTYYSHEAPADQECVPMRMARSFALLVLATSLCVVPVGAQSAKGNIRSVDFRDFTYKPYCNDEKPIQTRNGKFSRNVGEDKMDFTIFPGIAYGDLTDRKSTRLNS